MPPLYTHKLAPARYTPGRNENVWYTYINDKKVIVDAVSESSETTYNLNVFEYIGKHIVKCDTAQGHPNPVHCFVYKQKEK